MMDYYHSLAENSIKAHGKGNKVLLTLRYIFTDMLKLFMFLFRKIIFINKRFEYRGQRYPYFLHLYNRAWDNERIVEVAVIKEELKKASPEQTLEVGNVLSHHFHVNHTIVDKYEQAKGIINQDIVDYKPNRKYDLIITISTLEHVGFDESPKDPEKVKRAIAHLKTLLTKNGKLLITIPVNYNPGLDQMVFNNEIPCDEIIYMRRMTGINTWKCVDKEEVVDLKYGSPYGWANGLYIISINN